MENTVLVKPGKFCDEKKAYEFIAYSHDNTSIYVNRVENGVIKIFFETGIYDNSIIKIVSGCLTEDSNFVQQVYNLYGINKVPFRGISVFLNGVELLITSNNVMLDGVFSQWNKNFRKPDEVKLIKSVCFDVDSRKEEVLKIDETVELEFKNKKAEEFWNSLSTDVNLDYARRWAKFMQTLVENNDADVEIIADNIASKVDIDGVSGYGYFMAVKILTMVWKYGDELSKWYNKKCMKNEKTTLNKYMLYV